jgi:hypothetical protein
MSGIDYRLTTVKDKRSSKERMAVERRSVSTTQGDDVNYILEKDANLTISTYNPSDEERKALAIMRKHFTDADVVMRKPRREFNDLSVLSRMMVDQMSFNTYQPNNGDPVLGPGSWQSNAMRPIVRNKCISIAAHVTAHTIYPRVFAWNSESEPQNDAAMVMSDLYRWVGDRINYPYFSLKMVLTALWSPVAIGEVGYYETARKSWQENEDGELVEVTEPDEDYSGFQSDMVGCDELYIADFYEHDIQKQPYVIKRSVKYHDILAEKYGDNPNWKYVHKGMQVLYSDANQLFYEVYDSAMRQEMDEEVIEYTRNGTIRRVAVNGIMMTRWNEPNKRLDKRYPFIKFGFELLDEGQCFYYKSLAFKIQQDAGIVNTLYPMIVDGTYLNIMPPLLNTTGENIPASIVVPGSAITTSQPNKGDIKPLQVGNNLDVAFKTMEYVEDAVDESSPQLELGGHRISAFEMSIREQEAAVLLGLFTAMIGDMVRQMSKLIMSDILQYLTIGEASQIEGDDGLVYKSFMVSSNTKGMSSARHKRIMFDGSLPTEPIPLEDYKDTVLKLSLDTLKKQGGLKADSSLIRVNPSLFRELQFSGETSPDVLNPMSTETENAFRLEIYDRAIQNPAIAQDPDAMNAVTKDFLFGAFPQSDHNPDKYLPKKQQQGMMNPMQPPQPNQPTQQPPQKPKASPLNALQGQQPNGISKLGMGTPR